MNGSDSLDDVILDVRDLSVTYGVRKAVDGVSLRINRGEIRSSRAQRSRQDEHLERDRGPLRPTYLERWRWTGSMSSATRCRPIQDGRGLQATSYQPQLSIQADHPAVRRPLRHCHVQQEVTKASATIGLGPGCPQALQTTLGRQQQRLSLFIAIIHDPALLLLDEPTSGLDPQSRRQLWSRIEHLREQRGSILLTTHSMEEAQAVCDRIAIIDHGKILATDAPDN